MQTRTVSGKGRFGTCEYDGGASSEAVSSHREAAISEGRVDTVLATYPITDARKQQVDFAGPYFMAGRDLMVKTGDTAIKGISDLNGRKVCLTRTNPFTEPNVKSKAPQAEILVMTATAQCSEALAAGRVDAVASANAILLAQLEKAYAGGQWASAYAATLGKFGWKAPTPPPVDRYLTAAATTTTSRP